MAITGLKTVRHEKGTYFDNGHQRGIVKLFPFLLLLSIVPFMLVIGCTDNVLYGTESITVCKDQSPTANPYYSHSDCCEYGISAYIRGPEATEIALQNSERARKPYQDEEYLLVNMRDSSCQRGVPELIGGKGSNQAYFDHITIARSGNGWRGIEINDSNKITWFGYIVKKNEQVKLSYNHHFNRENEVNFLIGKKSMAQEIFGV